MPTTTFFNLPDDKRRLILDLAIEEFAENNYRQASISRIVARAGIAKGSFYQYFEDKRDLYLYLLQLAADEKRAFLRSTPPADSTGVFETIRWLFRHGMSFEFSNPRLAQIGFRAIYGDAPLPDEAGAVLRGSTAHFFEPLVAQGVAQGDIDPDYDPELAAFLFSAVFTQLGDYLLGRLGVAPQTLADRGGRELDSPAYWALIDDLIAMLRRALAPRPGGPADS